MTYGISYSSYPRRRVLALPVIPDAQSAIRNDEMALTRFL